MGLAGLLAVLAMVLQFPAIDFLDPAFTPGFLWVLPLLALSALVAIAAASLLREWRRKRFLHDLVAALLLPAMIAALPTVLLLGSATAHERVMALATPDISRESLLRLQEGFTKGRLTAQQYAQNCRYFRRWFYLEYGEVMHCRFPGETPLVIPDQVDLAEYAARFAATEQALQRQAGVLRAAAGLAWLGLLAGWAWGALRRVRD